MSTIGTNRRHAMERAKNHLDANDLNVIKQQALLMAKRTHGSKYEAEEYEQEVCFRWLVAPATFDASKGSREAYVKTFARRTIGKFVRNQFAQKRDLRRCVSLNNPVSVDGKQSSELAGRIVDPCSDDMDIHIDLAVALANLPAELRELAECLMHKSPTEVAAERNMAISSLQRQREQLRRALRRMGLKDSWRNSA
jgi:DNA-directed RNA polymerase specialized sigma24 family protein